MAKGDANRWKKIPKKKILDHFLTLPEKDRARILRNHLSAKTVSGVGAGEFDATLDNLKKKPEPEIRAFLTNDKNFGGRWQNLIPAGEHAAQGFLENIYGGKKLSDADKLYALVTSNTMQSRLRHFWEGVKGPVKEAYEQKGLASLNTRTLYYYLDNPENFVKGKSMDSFAEEVAKTMDLSKEKTVIEHLRDGAPAKDKRRWEKLKLGAQMCMIMPEGKLDPEDLAKKLQGEDWRKSVDPKKALKSLESRAELNLNTLGLRIKSAINNVAETEAEKELFREAAVQVCREAIALTPENSRNDPDTQELSKLATELQMGNLKQTLQQKPVQELRERLAAEYRTLDKEKSGFLLSKTNTPEHNAMMKGLRIFNAKLDLLNGKEPSGLTEEELKTAKSTDADVLLENAKRGCYNYGCLKTGSGTKGFWHDAGTERFDSSMKSLEHLNELGKQLKLSKPAAALRDDAQRQLLQNRRNKTWLAEHAEDLAAKTIYAQTLMNNGTPAKEQEKLLKDDALQAHVEKLKSKPAFKQMVKNVGPAGLADAMIKGVTGLAEIYQKAVKATEAKGHERTASEIAPADLQPTEATRGLSNTPHI